MTLHRFFSSLFDAMIAPTDRIRVYELRRKNPPLIVFRCGGLREWMDDCGLWFELLIAPRPDLRTKPGQMWPCGLRVRGGYVYVIYPAQSTPSRPSLFRFQHTFRGYWFWQIKSDAEEIVTRIARNCGQIG